jgi:hypothetical protein
MDLRMKLVALVLLASCAWAQQAEDAQPRVVAPGGPGKAPADAVVLFAGGDLAQWSTHGGQPARCHVESGEIVCRTGDGDLLSRPKFRGAQIHLEFNIPSMPAEKGQSRGNSGVYLQGRYEIQILDSYNNPTYPNGSCAALYGQAPPLVNASLPPGEWQTYDIVFHAPRCDAGKLLERGRLTLLHNGVLVQDNVAIRHTGRACEEGIGEPGPLLLQDHNYKGAPMTVMRFRNIWFRPLD